jgi:hypothetical protein
MTRLEKIKQTITAWDRQIEADVKAGKFDELAKESIAEHHAGRTKPL